MFRRARYIILILHMIPILFLFLSAFFFFCNSDLGKLAKPSHQMVLERALGIRNQSSPMLQLSHSSVW